MACGCAVVTADNGGTRDFVIDGQNGIVVPPKSAQPLADALIALLGDDARRTAYADRSVRLAQQFTLQASVERLVDALSHRSPAVAS
jgi:glycosyltransferase involved in cell wall biosynthesis